MRLLFAAAFALFAAALPGRAEAAPVTFAATADFGTQGGADLSATQLSFIVDPAAAIPRNAGGYRFEGVAGTLTLAGNTIAFTDARVVARQSGSGRNVVSLILNVGQPGELRLDFRTATGQAMPADAEAALLVAGFVDARLRGDVLGFAVDQRTTAFSASASIPLPAAAFLLAPGLALAGAARARSRRALAAA